MALTDERMASLMRYCKCDDDSDESKAEFEDMYRDAVSQMAEAGVMEPAEGTFRRAKYDMCVNALVLDSYDNRGTQIASASLVENPAFRRKLNQLKHTEAASMYGAASAVSEDSV